MFSRNIFQMGVKVSFFHTVCSFKMVTLIIFSSVILKPSKPLFFWLRFISTFLIANLTVTSLTTYMFICEMSSTDFQAIFNHFKDSPIDVVVGYFGNSFFGILLFILAIRMRKFASRLAKLHESIKNRIAIDSHALDKLTKSVFLQIAW